MRFGPGFAPAMQTPSLLIAAVLIYKAEARAKALNAMKEITEIDQELGLR